jgi:hypothetical protein
MRSVKLKILSRFGRETSAVDGDNSTVSRGDPWTAENVVKLWSCYEAQNNQILKNRN